MVIALTTGSESGTAGKRRVNEFLSATLVFLETTRPNAFSMRSSRRARSKSIARDGIYQRHMSNSTRLFGQ